MSQSLSAIEILALHQAIHGELGTRDREAFLERPETVELVGLTAAAVQHGFLKSRRLKEALPAAKAVDFWFRGDDCEEDGIPYCARCKPSGLPKTVVISTGSKAAAFHSNGACEALRAGQERVRRSGGDPAPTMTVAVGVALSRGMFPCLVCLQSRG